MFINLCPEAIGLHGLKLQQRIALASRHGFGGVDLPIDEVAQMPDPMLARQMLEEAKLQWGLFRLPGDFFCDDELQFQQAMGRLKAIAPLVQKLGCRRTYDHIWCGHNARPYQENFRFHVERLKALAGVLAEHGILFGIEFLGPRTLRDGFKHPFIHTLEQAMELADAVDRSSAVGIALDSFHWYTSGGTTDAISRHLTAERIAIVHTNDARPGRTRDQQQDMERALPTETGVIDLAGFVGALRKLNYQGPVIAEPFQPQAARLSKLPLDEAAACVMEYMRRLMALT